MAGGASVGARAMFLSNSLDVSGVVSCYRHWLSFFFYVCFTKVINDVSYYGVLLGVKRGDSRYSAMVCKKFNSLSRFGKEMKYFGYGSHEVVSGSCLLATLEYNSNLISMSDSWLNVGKDFNRWICGVRRKFGKVSIVRVFEAHESGYPHIHVLMVFHDKTFFGRSMKGKKGFSYRVTGSDFDNLKSLFKGDFKVSDRWVHGFTDFQLVSSYQGGIRYLSKYLAKSTSAVESGSKGIRTLAMCWVFHKRSFGFQGDLFSSDVIRTNGISNADDSVSTRWSVLGYISREVPMWSGGRCFRLIRGSDLVLVKDRNDGFGSRVPNLYDVADSTIFSVNNRVCLPDERLNGSLDIFNFYW